VVGSTDLRGNTSLVTELKSSESRSIDSVTVGDWKNYSLLQEI
jgi:hypothetical protein